MADKNNNDDQFFDESGFAKNIDIDIDSDKKKNKKRFAEYPEIDDMMEQFKNMFGGQDMKSKMDEEIENLSEDELDEITKQFNDSMKVFGIQINKGNMNNELTDMLQKLLTGASTFLPSFDDEDENEEDEEGTYYALDSKQFLDPSFFGSVECTQDPELYEKFIARYGTDSTKYLDDNIGIKQFNVSELTEQLPFQGIKNLKLVSHNDEFILFFAEPEEKTQYGFFISVIEDENGEFCVLVPEYFNTFKVDSDDNVSLFDINEDEDVFLRNRNNVLSFKYLSIPAVEFSTRFMLSPKKNTLLTPHQFGTIKNTMAPVSGYTSFIKVGNITSNESSEAILFKKDACVSTEQMTFPFYIKLSEAIREETAMELEEVLFKVNFNECPLFDNVELHYTYNGEFYVEIDLGDII